MGASWFRIIARMMRQFWYAMTHRSPGRESGVSLCDHGRAFVRQQAAVFEVVKPPGNRHELFERRTPPRLARVGRENGTYQGALQ